MTTNISSEGLNIPNNKSGGGGSQEYDYGNEDDEEDKKNSSEDIESQVAESMGPTSSICGDIESTLEAYRYLVSKEIMANLGKYFSYLIIFNIG